MGNGCSRRYRLFRYAFDFIFLYPPEIKETPNAVQFAKDRLSEMGKMSADEIIMAVIFGILLLLWADVPALITGNHAFSINATATAFIGLSLLLLSGVLTWDDVLKEKARGIRLFGLAH